MLPRGRLRRSGATGDNIHTRLASELIFLSDASNVSLWCGGCALVPAAWFMVAQIDRGARVGRPGPATARRSIRVMCSPALPLSAVCGPRPPGLRHCARPPPAGGVRLRVAARAALRRRTRAGRPIENRRQSSAPVNHAGHSIVLPTHSPLSSLSPHLDFPAGHLHADLVLPRPNLPPLSSCAQLLARAAQPENPRRKEISRSARCPT